MATPRQRAQSRNGRLGRLNSRVEWYGNQVRAGVVFTMEQRLAFAAQYLRDKVVFNISIPVGRSGGATARSLPGQFPRADTTRLMKDVFFARASRMMYRVGITLDYGVYLELQMNRSFLVRTIEEERNKLRQILTGRTGR